MVFPSRRSVCPIPCCTSQTIYRRQTPSEHSVLERHIGVVVFQTHKGERAEAILDVEGVWRCPRLPVLDRVLNARASATLGDSGKM